MKHEKTKRALISDIQRWANQVHAYRLPSGPFDYSVQARAAVEAQEFFQRVVAACRLSHADPEAKAVIEASRRLYHTALGQAYPPGFWEDYERLRAGDPTGLESAVQFLEADPIFFRSGYVKQKLIRAIKTPMLTPEYVERLQQVVLAVVDRRYDRDLGSYRNLAWKVYSPYLRARLEQRVSDGTLSIRSRARWMLEELEKNQPKAKQT